MFTFVGHVPRRACEIDIFEPREILLNHIRYALLQIGRSQYYGPVGHAMCKGVILTVVAVLLPSFHTVGVTCDCECDREPAQDPW